MAKFAMHNDPKLRKIKYDEKESVFSGSRYNEGRMESEGGGV